MVQVRDGFDAHPVAQRANILDRDPPPEGRAGTLMVPDVWWDGEEVAARELAREEEERGEVEPEEEEGRYPVCPDCGETVEAEVPERCGGCGLVFGPPELPEVAWMDGEEAREELACPSCGGGMYYHQYEGMRFGPPVRVDAERDEREPEGLTTSGRVFTEASGGRIECDRCHRSWREPAGIVLDLL